MPADKPAPNNGDILGLFRPEVATWFRDVFAHPTAVQKAAWQAIAAGEHALVVAPTGSGKTLAAFLWAINNLVEPAGQGTLALDSAGATGSAGTPTGHRRVKVLYISPLKALGVDVENNLRAPLGGIARVAARLGCEQPNISVGVRSGDTPAAERSRIQRKPPDILITTPESAYLMLTSKAAGILRDVDTVIIDEIHALAGSKRGAHLALTLERLEALNPERSIQRIGLSATVRPIDRVARFLGGDRPVEIINPASEKTWDLLVRTPVDDMSDLPTPEPGSTIGEATIDDPLGLLGEPDYAASPSSAGAADGFPAEGAGEGMPHHDAGGRESESALPQQGSIWPFIEEQVYEEILGARSTLIFVNSRRSAERLTSRINELWAREHAPEELAAARRRPPAQLGGPSDIAGAASTVIARAHHGSVSKDERALTEKMLKEGSLKAVVATSSLELGIDMGAVDLVLQVESPPSVAAGLQRVGRAGHGVGEISRGIFHPKHRSDLLQSAITLKRMLAGQIEELQTISNPLDVLAQQTVAAVAAAGSGGLSTDAWYEIVCRAHPYRELSREVFDSVIDLVSGIYPATDFADLKPRVVHDRTSGVLTPRPGAQRLAVTSGGTIPDRGMFGVFLMHGAGEGSGAPRRVGELDEEMVYESRVGDIFTLGASSWRIEEITRDQVLVTPAPGHTGRLPFWHGDQLGRPVELGKALGAFRREAHGDAAVLAGWGLDRRSQSNISAFLSEQEEATGVVPDERTLVLERFRDELGDWRVVLHTPFGRGVNAAWALAVGAQIAERTGMDAQAVAGDDGIVLRLPEGEVDPGAELFALPSEDIEAIVTEQVGNSALFASRFRECAARALLLPRRNPGKRAPLWQQRQRAEQLLDVARKYPSFPIILETVRECLRDVYDLPALVSILEDIEHRRVMISEVTTSAPSPFASSLLFNYTGAFMYEGDTPLAEKRAAALALDPALLAKLLGTVELRELLVPEIIAETHAQLQHIADGYRARSAEELVDQLRVLGPIALADLGKHCDFEGIEHVIDTQLRGRVMRVRIDGVEHLAQVEDAALLRDGLGIPVPPGVPAQQDSIVDAPQQLISRWARARGPFTLRECAEAFGFSAGVTHQILSALTKDASRGLIQGHYRQGVAEEEYIASSVLKIIRSRSLAAARAEAEPISPSAYARFLMEWQQVAAMGEQPELRGSDGVFAVIEQLAGVRLPASAWETLVLPSRVRDYQPGMLDELTISGEVLIVGAGQAASQDPWVMLLPADYAPEIIELPDAVGEGAEAGAGSGSGASPTLSKVQEEIMEKLSTGGAFHPTELFRHLHGEDLGIVAGTITVQELSEALWDLLARGLAAPDSFAAVRAHLSMTRSGSANRASSAAHRVKRRPGRSRVGRGRLSRRSLGTSGVGAAVSLPPDLASAGRWAASPRANTEATARGVLHGELWLDRYGVVTRGGIVNEQVTGGFALAYRVLSRFEENGKALRGHIVEGLGAAQFSTPAIIDRARAFADSLDHHGWPSGTQDPKVYVLAATDPANPYGSVLPWPEDSRGLSRSAGAMVVIADGLLVAYISRGGKNLQLLPTAQHDEVEIAELVVPALNDVIERGLVQPLRVEKLNGEAIFGHPLVPQLRAAGAVLSPKGLKLQGHPKPSSSPRVSRAGLDGGLPSFDDPSFEDQTEADNPEFPQGEYQQGGYPQGGFMSGGRRRKPYGKPRGRR